jgi:Flp pilus assembly protein TadG
MNRSLLNRARRRKATRGAVLVEYALLLTAFAIPAMMGIVAGGVAMMRDYQDARTQLLRPFP